MRYKMTATYFFKKLNNNLSTVTEKYTRIEKLVNNLLSFDEADDDGGRAVDDGL